MEPMVRPARPVSWNRRNRQGTVWNRPEPEPFATGSKWNRNRVEPKPDGTGTKPAQPGPWPCLNKTKVTKTTKQQQQQSTSKGTL